MEKRPILLKIAITATAASPLIALLATFTHNPEVHHVLVAVAAGLLLAGTGEILNHPLQTEMRTGEKDAKDTQRRHHHHRRNPCGLGNLLFIAGMLLLFITLGRVISF